LLDFVTKVLVAYLIGSLLGSLIIGKLRGGIDIRNLGSGNAGGTNALRTQGFWFALGVMVIDVGKGWLAAAILPTSFQLGQPAPPMLSSSLSIACAGAVVIGHVYPIFFGFRGGKGAATLIGVVVANRLCRASHHARDRFVPHLRWLVAKIRATHIFWHRDGVFCRLHPPRQYQAHAQRNGKSRQ